MTGFVFPFFFIRQAVHHCHDWLTVTGLVGWLKACQVSYSSSSSSSANAIVAMFVMI